MLLVHKLVPSLPQSISIVRGVCLDNHLSWWLDGVKSPVHRCCGVNADQPRYLGAKQRNEKKSQEYFQIPAVTCHQVINTQSYKKSLETETWKSSVNYTSIISCDHRKVLEKYIMFCCTGFLCWSQQCNLSASTWTWVNFFKINQHQAHCILHKLCFEGNFFRKWRATLIK